MKNKSWESSTRWTVILPEVSHFLKPSRRRRHVSPALSTIGVGSHVRQGYAPVVRKKYGEGKERMEAAVRKMDDRRIEDGNPFSRSVLLASGRRSSPTLGCSTKQVIITSILLLLLLLRQRLTPRSSNTITVVQDQTLSTTVIQKWLCNGNE
jgi:hypothetical protein